MSDNTQDEPLKFKTKNWIEINNKSLGMYSTGRQVIFKNLMLRPSLCDCSDAHILVKGTTTIPNKETPEARKNRSKAVIFKNCAPYTDCNSEINNTEMDHCKDIDVVIAMYNLIQHVIVTAFRKHLKVMTIL